MHSRVAQKPQRTHMPWNTDPAAPLEQRWSMPHVLGVEGQ